MFIEDTYGDAPPPPQRRAQKSMTQDGVVALDDEKGASRSQKYGEK